jgi:hypothetical protein
VLPLVRGLGKSASVLVKKSAGTVGYVEEREMGVDSRLEVPPTSPDDIEVDSLT